VGKASDELLAEHDFLVIWSKGPNKINAGVAATMSSFVGRPQRNNNGADIEPHTPISCPSTNEAISVAERKEPLD
jgi:hypothetical protein